jgi:hypothetical protein
VDSESAGPYERARDQTDSRKFTSGKGQSATHNAAIVIYRLPTLVVDSPLEVVSMFEQLFNSRIMEKVLFYMVINKKCFASELRRCFGIPVFGIQRALTRLENQGILVSTVEGSNRIYHWNPRYPFLEEFKYFIEKAYSSLPENMRKQFYERSVRKRPRKKGKPL